MSTFTHLQGVVNYTHTPNLHPLHPSADNPPEPFSDSVDVTVLTGAFCRIAVLSLFQGEKLVTINVGHGHMVFWTITIQDADSPCIVHASGNHLGENNKEFISHLMTALPSGLSHKIGYLTHLIFH